jgi:hypothetical protein
MEEDRELVLEIALNEQLRFDLLVTDNMSEAEFSKISNRLSRRIKELSGLQVAMQYSQDIWTQKEKTISFICSFTPPDLATLEQIQAFITAMYQFAAELDSKNFSLSMAAHGDMLPLVTADGIVTPISFQPHTDYDIGVNEKYRKIKLASITSMIGDALPLVFKLHQEGSERVLNSYAGKPRAQQSYITEAMLNKKSFNNMDPDEKLQFLSPMFKPQFNRARNFIFGGLAGSFLGAAAISLAFLLLPPPLSFVAAGIGAALLVAGLITIGINFWQSRNLNHHIKASLKQMNENVAPEESGSFQVSSDLAVLGSESAPVNGTGLEHFGPSPIGQPGLSSRYTKYDAMLLNLGGLLKMHNNIVHAGGSMDTIMLRLAFLNETEALNNLLADTHDGLDEQKARARELIQGYKEYGIELPAESAPAPK